MRNCPSLLRGKCRVALPNALQKFQAFRETWSRRASEHPLAYNTRTPGRATGSKAVPTVEAAQFDVATLLPSCTTAADGPRCVPWRKLRRRWLASPSRCVANLFVPHELPQRLGDVMP